MDAKQMHEAGRRKLLFQTGVVGKEFDAVMGRGWRSLCSMCSVRSLSGEERSVPHSRTAVESDDTCSSLTLVYHVMLPAVSLRLALYRNISCRLGCWGETFAAFRLPARSEQAGQLTMLERRRRAAFHSIHCLSSTPVCCQKRLFLLTLRYADSLHTAPLLGVWSCFVRPGSV